MQKLLIGKYGDYTIYHTDNNSISYSVENDDIEVKSIFLAKLDGQAISESEVVDYKLGDLVLSLLYYGKGIKPIYKIIVCTDIVANDDLTRWIQELKEVNNETI